MKHFPKLLVVAALTTLCAPATAADTPLLSSPAGGWTYKDLSDHSSKLTYAYPNNLIDRGGQRQRTLIEGRLKAIGKHRKLPVLVVNGNPMLLHTDEEGRFARPYAFGPGSNSIEIRGGDGQSLKRIQFYEANRQVATARIRIILSWDDPQAELDLHVLTPDGQHAFFGRPVLSNGGGLDVDSVDGAGPEMFSMTAPVLGVYRVYVNYWGNFGANGYHFDESTREREMITAAITLVFNENTPAEKREMFRVPMRKIGDLNLVKSFVLGS